MKNNRTNSWILWTILVFGLLIAAGCGSNPTTPGPSDVKDFGFDNGGLPVDSDMDACLAAYNVLKQNGGGVTTVVNDHGYTLIGAFERWSGVGLQGIRLTIHEDDGTTSIHSFNGKIALTDLVFPIIVTAFVPGHTAETIVGTSANVIVFGLDLLESNKHQALVIGYSMNVSDPSQTSNWLVVANSTHGHQWEYFQGGSFANPHARLSVDAHRPVGAVAFLYKYKSELGEPVSGLQPDTVTTDNFDDFDALGYSYGHIGVLEPGAIGAWIMDLNEEGAGADRGTANYTITNIPADPDTQIGSMVLTPGGTIDNSEEFVPYYPSANVAVADATGEYSLTSYEPPTAFDRDVIQVNATYSDGSTGSALVDWNVGSGLPDIVLKDVPTCSNAIISNAPVMSQYFNADWVGLPDTGYILVTVTDALGDVLWDIRLTDDATALPVDTLFIPMNAAMIINVNPQAATVKYVTCDTFDIDDFSVAGLFAATESWSVSAKEGLTLDPGAPSIIPPDLDPIEL